MDTTITKPTKGWSAINFKEIWKYRELLYFFVWRDLKVKYKQTAIGVAWAIIQPVSTVIIFSLVSRILGQIYSDGLPYPIFCYSALVPWTYFANSLNSATNNLVDHQQIITKIYFPKILLPLSSVLDNLVDCFIAFIVLIGMMFFYHIIPTGKIFLFPLFLLLTLFTSLGVGLWLSALNVEYRDIRHAITFIIQSWFFASPIIYSYSKIPVKWRTVYNLNPMVGIIEGFKCSLLGKPFPDIKMFYISVPGIFIILIGGLFYFKKMEKTFADIV